MIKLGRFSVAMPAAALLLCAFAVASQNKNAPSNVEKNPPSSVVLEDHFEKLQADFLKIKQELEQKLDTTNRRLDGIDRLILSIRKGNSRRLVRLATRARYHKS